MIPFCTFLVTWRFSERLKLVVEFKLAKVQYLFCPRADFGQMGVGSQESQKTFLICSREEVFYAQARIYFAAFLLGPVILSFEEYIHVGLNLGDLCSFSCDMEVILSRLKFH